MKKLTRAIIIILLMALLSAVISCSSDDKKSGGDISPEIQSDEINSDSGFGIETEKSDPEESKSPVPDDVTFGGQTVRFFNYYPEAEDNGTIDPAMATILNAEEAAGDVVYEAIYRRNMEVQAKLGVTFEFTYCPPNADPDTYQNSHISKLVKAGTDDYDIVLGKQWQCVQLATQDIFKNIKNLPYLDINNPWWATKYINDVTIGRDVLMYVTGDISTKWLLKLGTMYYNKELYKSNLGDPDDMYRLVLDGKWTMDAFNEKVKVMYSDLNGNGLPDDEDQYGLITHTISITDLFTYASGIRATDRNSDGFPYFIMNSEKTYSFVDKLHDIYFNNPGTFVVLSNHPRFSTIINDKFAENQVLFIPGTLEVSGQLRSMKTDFGMIPFPKLDEKESSYLSLVHDTAPLMCVPATCSKDDELIGAVLEEMAYKGYIHMTPAYFDVALKNKYMRDSDDMSMQCIDLIRENAITDFAYVYNYALKANSATYSDNVGLIMRDVMGAKSSNFVSYWEKIEEVANKNLQKIIDAYIN
ncbi:MAG: extracellular solute-binding protein [Oscillospiraceae bacterium]|nr:extracellular solute-binding protein [Oscillospiraceae bacterium]